MKLWDKGLEINKEIEKFTVGNDHITDLKLVEYDCIGSIAHAKMLNKIKIITDDECSKLTNELNNIIKLHKSNNFMISLADEDCHTAIEKHLTKKLGDIGKKIHTGRSRNDQVLTAIRLYEKKKLNDIISLIKSYIETLKDKIQEHGKTPFPGYTHMQKAMPSSIGLWLSSYLDSMEDNLSQMQFLQNYINKNPLGTAAGYGVPIFDLDVEMTTNELGFANYFQNPIYAQMSRGKFESNIINGLVQIMIDLNKISSDMILFSMKEFDYITLPKEFCTGSSIMPQKNNPDVLELVRAKYHILLGEEFKIKSLISNLISGYNRDVQLTKDPIMNSFDILESSLKMIILIIKNLKINTENCKSSMTDELYATQEAYELIKTGMTFRDAYKKIGKKFS